MPGLWTQLNKFTELDRPQRSAVIRATFWLPVFWLGLHGLGLSRFRAMLLRNGPVAKSGLGSGQIRSFSQAIAIAARHGPFPSSCLTRSLLLCWMLRREGVNSQMRIGVRMVQGALDAHAWVECDGIPINDQPDIGQQFAPFHDPVGLNAFRPE